MSIIFIFEKTFKLDDNIDKHGGTHHPTANHQNFHNYHNNDELYPLSYIRNKLIY